MSGDYMVYLLCAIGLTVLVVVMEEGPGAWVREAVLRPGAEMLIGAAAKKLLGCGVCFGAWAGLAVGAVVWVATGRTLPALTLWLTTPAVFWIVKRLGCGGSGEPGEGGS